MINSISKIITENNKEKTTINEDKPNKKSNEDENITKEESKLASNINKEAENQLYKQKLQIKETNIKKKLRFKISTSIFHFSLLQKQINYNFIKAIIEQGNININKIMKNG